MQIGRVLKHTNKCVMTEAVIYSTVLLILIENKDAVVILAHCVFTLTVKTYLLFNL